MKWKLFLGALALGAALIAYLPATRPAALALIGQANGCPVPHALSIPRHKRELTETKDRILAASRLIETDEQGYEHYETPHGRFWTPAGSRYILPFNLAEQAVSIYGTGENGVQKGDYVLDCGANVGTFARFALDAGAAKVVAIEPSPENLECLRRNFAPEIADGRLVVYPKGVWHEDAFLDLIVDPANRAADSFVIQREGTQLIARVPLTTIDKMLKKLNLERVDYIKMDIEGAEVNALRGARETLRRFRPRMSISAYHVPTDPVEIPRAVREAWPDVKIECGPCAYADGVVRPDVLYFRR